MDRQQAIRCWGAAALLVAGLLVTGIFTPTAPAQEVADKASAPAFQPPTVASRVRRLLKQRAALVADGEWDEVIDLTEELQLDLGDEWLGMTASAERYETVANYCQRMFLQAPPEGLNAYRRRVDSIAERWLREGIQRLDESLLQRVTDELFASSYGDDALLALGELALQRGDTAAARRYWRRIDPRLFGPRGEPIGMALAEIDPEVDLDRLAEIWTRLARPTDLLVYPDSNIPIADVLVRLCVTSLREGDTDRAEVELRLLEALAPEASGRLAGRNQPYVKALTDMIEAASSSPNKRRREQLDSLHAWSWPEPVTAERLKLNPQQQLAKRMAAQQQLARRRLLLNQQALLRQRGLALGGRWAIPPAQAPTPPPITAVASAQRIVFTDAKGLRSIDIATGKVATVLWPGDPEPSKPVEPAPAIAGQRGGNRIIMNGGQIVIRGGGRIQGGVHIQGGQVQWFGSQQGSMNLLLQPTVLAPSLALSGDVLYAVRSQLVTERTQQRLSRVRKETLVGLDLSSDAKLVLEIQGTEIEEGQAFRFSSPPVIRGDRLYLVLTDRESPSRLSAACFSKANGRLIWRTPLGTGQPIASRSEVTLSVTLAGDTIYTVTHQGAIVALDASTGRLRWLTRYQRLPMATMPIDQEPSPCIVRGDQLYVAPIDSPVVMAIDTVTGGPLWTASAPAGAASIVGVVGKSLVLAGRRVVSYDTRTGQQRFAWPESDHAGIRGQGRALIAGGELFWPTRDRVFILDPETGRSTRSPINLESVGSEGANLVRAGQQLLVAGPEKISLRGATPAVQKEPKPGLSRRTEGPLPAFPTDLLVIRTTLPLIP